MNINVKISVDFLWNGNHFNKNEWGSITYIVGANGTGKSIFAEKLKEEFKKKESKSVPLKVRYFGAERMHSLASKCDDHGYLNSDNLQNGLNIGRFSGYKNRAEDLGQSVDALIELRNKLDLQIRIESILSDVFNKRISFEETGGFLNVKIQGAGEAYDLKKNESHGLKEIITLLTFLYDDEYDCIILDEPELNLHPQFQQYILQEIKKLAGDPFQKTGKMFIILTHSPYMLSIQNSEDLKNVIVFHKNEVPTYINDYSALISDESRLQRLNKLLARMNVNHKSFFFADKPVFVEGYIDQQIYNALQYKRGIPLGAIGVSFIDVGGKDEVELMYLLCQFLKINAHCIVDLDALFEGRLRQTADRNEKTGAYMAEQGYKSLMEEIGNLEKTINELVDELICFKPENSPDGEVQQFIDALKAQTGSKRIRQRIFAVGIHRIKAEITNFLSEKSKLKIDRMLALEEKILNCLKSVNIYVLKKGEIENYYKTSIENHYQIPDARKTYYYTKETQLIEEKMDKETVETSYSDIILILNDICKEIQIGTEKILSKKIGNWIHSVQTVLRSDPYLTMEQIKTIPEIKLDSYKRIIEMINLKHNDEGYCCEFKISRNLTKNPEKIYRFDNKTVAANFAV